MKYLILFLIIIKTGAFAFAQTAVIREVTGTVELKRSANADWTPANPGDRLNKDTIVSTGFKSTAVIETGNSVIVVRPVTRLSLEALIGMNESQTVNVNMQAGRIRVDVNPTAASRSDFSVQTPSSVASVRGTSFEQDSENIEVSEGVVRFETAADVPANPVLVTANQSSWIDSDTGKPVKAVDAAVIKRRLPRLPGEEAMPNIRRAGIAGGGVLDPFGNIDVGVNLANNQGEINIGTNLGNSHGGIDIGTNLTGGQGTIDIDVTLTK